VTRTAIVTTSYPQFAGDPSGHFVRTEALARGATGERVTVIAPGPGHATDDPVTVKWLDVGSAFGWPGALARIRARPWRAVSAGAFVVAARRALSALGPVDAVVAHWLLPTAWPVALAATGGTPLEVVVHGSDVGLLERFPRAVRRHVLSVLVERGARFRFVSTDLRERVVKSTGLEEVRSLCSVEPCAIDVSGVPGRGAARLALGVGESERLAVVVGRLVPSKRPEEAVSLALTLADNVVVVGDGPMASQLARAHPQAKLLGRLPRCETLTWLSAADLLVSASRDEGAPTTIREARALGAAVLAAPCGDVREWARSDPGITLI
jgi:teichuronic acid biosynthesis glycosyltransferase TuaC